MEENWEQFDWEALAQRFSPVFDCIVDDAIHDGKRLCRNFLCRARHYSRAWRDSVCRSLERRNEPLYTVTLTKENCLNASAFVEEHGKEVDNFVRFMLSSSSQDLQSFRLVVHPEVFCTENYDALVNCLKQCGSSLHELHLSIPVNIGFPAGHVPPNFPLLSLRRLNCSFFSREPIVPQQEVIRQKYLDGITFLQFLLLNASKLKELQFFQANLSALKKLFLPPSLTRLELDLRRSEVTSEQLELLISNSLPNLEELHLEGRFTEPLPSDVMLQILEKFRGNLRCLVLEGPYSYLPTLLYFPRMEMLETLKIRSDTWQLYASIPDLNAVFPKLRSLSLWMESNEMLAKWATNSSSPLVSLEELHLWLQDPDTGVYSMDGACMASVHHTFPSLRKLKFAVSVTQSRDVLRFVFGNMRQLRHLSITLGDQQSIEGTIHFDALLLGVPEDRISQMDALADSKVEYPSIKLLSELESLNLCHFQNSRDATMGPLISQLAYAHALNHMPKLKDLELQGRFKINCKCVIRVKTIDGRWMCSCG